MISTKTTLLITISVVVLAVAFLFIPQKINPACTKDADCSSVCADCICANGTCMHRVNESEIADIIDSKFPDSRKDITFDSECGESGCWKAEILTNTTGGGFEHGIGITMDPAGNIIEELIYCDPVFSETESTPNESREIWYYNVECDNPQPYCDISKGLCKRCSSSSQCMRKIITIISSGNSLSTHYDFEIKGSGFRATYDDSNRTCIVMSSGNTIFSSNLPTMDECEEKIFSHARCSGGICGAV